MTLFAWLKMRHETKSNDSVAIQRGIVFMLVPLLTSTFEIFIQLPHIKWLSDNTLSKFLLQLNIFVSYVKGDIFDV